MGLRVKRGSGKRVYYCSECGETANYYAQCDTFACLTCDAWLDPCTCNEEAERYNLLTKCPFSKLPLKPSMVVVE